MHRDSAVQEVRVRSVRVPMTEPHKTAGGIVAESPLILTDVVTDSGTIGHSLLFTYTPAALKPTAELIRNIEPLIKGEPLAPAEIEQKLTTVVSILRHPVCGDESSSCVAFCR
nr:hypothetical protein [Fimbriiglobus ruber]